MLNGWFEGKTGSGTIVWKAKELLAAKKLMMMNLLNSLPLLLHHLDIVILWVLLQQ